MVFTCFCIRCLLIQLTDVASHLFVSTTRRFKAMVLRYEELGGFGLKWSCPQLSPKSPHTGEGAAENTKTRGQLVSPRVFEPSRREVRTFSL
jgi:hypothetical protein